MRWMRVFHRNQPRCGGRPTNGYRPNTTRYSSDGLWVQWPPQTGSALAWGVGEQPIIADGDGAYVRPWKWVAKPRTGHATWWREMDARWAPIGRSAACHLSPALHRYMQRTSEAQLGNVGMALSMIIAVLVTVVSTALIVGGTPPTFIPVTKGEGNKQRGSTRRRQK
jgi:hypothetical protein